MLGRDSESMHRVMRSSIRPLVAAMRSRLVLTVRYGGPFSGRHTLPWSMPKKMCTGFELGSTCLYVGRRP